MVGCTALEAQQSPDPSIFCTWWEGSSSLPGLVPSSDTGNSESLVGITPSDSDAMITYQVDEFIHTWSMEQFVANSHIYQGFICKVSSLNHFPLEPGCEGYSFLDQTIAGVEQGLDSNRIDSIMTLELDASFDETDVIASSFSSGFPQWLSTGFDTSKLQLFKLWCQAGELFHLCLWPPRCKYWN